MLTPSQLDRLRKLLHLEQLELTFQRRQIIQTFSAAHPRAAELTAEMEEIRATLAALDDPQQVAA